MRKAKTFLRRAGTGRGQGDRVVLETQSCCRPRLAGKRRASAKRPGPPGCRLAGAVLILLLAGCQQLSEIDLPWPSAAETTAPTKADPAQAPVADKETVRRAQEGLAALGYRPGPADGMPGPRTREAIAAFQRDSGLPADGRVTEELVGWIESALERGKQKPRPPKTAHQKEHSNGREAVLDRSLLPRYRRDSTFVYSDGRIDRLTGERGETLRWTGTDGRLSTTYRNFLLPPAHWKEGGEEGTADLSADSNSLWPLSSDAPTRFSVEVTLRTGAGSSGLSRYKEDWTCGLRAGETVLVPAGRFTTVKFVCDRAAKDFRPAVKQVWHYAPTIGHYVRREERRKVSSSRVELVAILPSAGDWPPIVRAALDRAVQDALDETADGKTRTWSSSGLDTTVDITPTRSYKGAKGQSCRSYIQTWKRESTRERYPATACRGAEGRWVIPGMEGQPQSSISISQR